MFRFRLQSLLQHRRHLEDNCRQDLARVQKELQAEEAKLRQLLSQKTARQQQMAQIQKGGHTAARMLPYQNYLNVLEQDIDGQQEKIRRIKAKVEQERCRLMEAVKQRKIIDRLKETEHNRFQREQKKKEQNQMNEIASQRHVRNLPH